MEKEEFDKKFLQKKEQENKHMQAALTKILNIIDQKNNSSEMLLLSNDSPLLTAFSLVADYHNIKIEAIPEKSKTDLKSICDVVGVRYRQVLLEGDWWQQDSGPLIAYLKADQSPVALLPESNGKYTLYNPLTKATQKVDVDLAEKLKKTAIYIYKSFPNKALTTKDLLLFGRQSFSLKDILFLFLSGIMGGILALAIPRASAIIFNVIIPEGEKGEIWQLAVILLAAVIAKSLFELTRSFSFVHIKNKLSFSLHAAVWDRILALPVSFFKDHQAGELAQKAMGIIKIKDLFNDLVITSILAGLFSVFYYLFMFSISPGLTLTVTLIILLTFLLTLSLALLQLKYKRELQKEINQLSAYLFQVISGISKIRAAAAENRFFFHWTEKFTRQRKLTLKAQSFDNYLTAFTAFLPLVSAVFIFYFVSVNEILSIGDFIAFNAAFIAFQAAIISLSLSLIKVLDARIYLDNMKCILKTLPEDTERKKIVSNFEGEIEVNNLSFKYKNNENQILENLNFKIKPGEYVAFVGPSGSGKSTLLRLLLGFEKAQIGSIYYDDYNLDKLSVKELRKELGIVLQDSQLMSGSIYSNIIGSSIDLNVEDAWKAARAAGLEDDIRNMPMGMHTIINQGQQSLSGGQKQRLLIARAVVKKPKLIFFDEATSALDNKTQSLVTTAMNQFKATKIIIAHRLSTIKECDRIFVLANGRIVETGDYKSLIKKGGLFKNLVERQMV
ncbi:ATP-binding cassette subfamily C protein [Halanaerobium saccharolyticum]|uniref:ATP-binding cassette subfamily C protein n=1 Tax=Halanaerobium saccharolyticum TaxID=43595 RepID=A0A4R6M210_9FIRM|nr:NHLP bacteriocin export ABC transporter permease/ATPase subunit [Halanaerobium saccharolyticum]TDO95271.1 ATP-binding cassette subfamily C protein [Halanaerobium saccharolyticum]